MIYGNIHSIETCGTVDGPGVRFVVFMQGCPMRCLYCHNPDTWAICHNSLPLGEGAVVYELANSTTAGEGSKSMSVAQILEQYDGVKEFCKGGITVTGGEPLLQIDFVIELFKKAKEKNIHTCLDTSGITYNMPSVCVRGQNFNTSDTSIRNSGEGDKFDELIKYTNLVLLDIKHIDDYEHKKLTGHSNKNILEFAKYLSDKNIPVWIRHVVVPGITFNEKYLRELGRFIKTLKNVEALDVLPYHDMAVKKYESLGIDYPLKNIKPLTKEDTIKARDIILEELKK